MRYLPRDVQRRVQVAVQFSQSKQIGEDIRRKALTIPAPVDKQIIEAVPAFERCVPTGRQHVGDAWELLRQGIGAHVVGQGSHPYGGPWQKQKRRLCSTKMYRWTLAGFRRYIFRSLVQTIRWYGLPTLIDRHGNKKRQASYAWVADRAALEPKPVALSCSSHCKSSWRAMNVEVKVIFQALILVTFRRRRAVNASDNVTVGRSAQ